MTIKKISDTEIEITTEIKRIKSLVQLKQEKENIHNQVLYFQSKEAEVDSLIKEATDLGIKAVSEEIKSDN